jgi:polysaccharide export outer membrane protein
MPTKFFKAMTQPIAGLTLYALMAASWSSRAVAQLPTLQPEQLQQTPLDNRLRQLQQARRSNPSSQLQSAYIQGRGDRLFMNDFQALLRTGDRTQDLTGPDANTIFIPPVTTVNLQQTRQLATASFAAEPNRARTVAVVGEIKRPGSYSLIGTETGHAGSIGGLPTVTLALQQAQGINPLADIRNIQIRRQTSAGAEQIIKVNLWQLLQTGDFNQDAILQEGDTVVVPKATGRITTVAVEAGQARFSPDPINVSLVREVQAPATLKVPNNTTLNQALLNAGGFKESRARRSNVELIRLNPNGTISRENVPVDFAQGTNAKNNRILRENDIVVVSRSNTARVADALNLFISPDAGIIRLFSILGIR